MSQSHEVSFPIHQDPQRHYLEGFGIVQRERDHEKTRIAISEELSCCVLYNPGAGDQAERIGAFILGNKECYLLKGLDGHSFSDWHFIPTEVENVADCDHG